MIKVENVTKAHRIHEKEPGIKGSVKAIFRRKWTDKVALDGVSLEVAPGETIGLLGANGAGKTTLIKLMTGIIEPTSGSAQVLGHVPWRRSNTFRRQISVVMGQKSQLWWDLPAGDCFLVLKGIYGLDDASFRATLGELTEHLDVARLMKTQMRRLSLGERMKMEIIAALLHRPKVIFLDEPTIGLDFSSQRAIRQFLKTYRSEHQCSIVLTSHYLEDISSLCERVVVLRQGRMVHDGSLTALSRATGGKKTVTFRSGGDIEVESYVSPCGAILQRNADAIWSLDVQQDHVAGVLRDILQRFDAADLTVRDPDLSLSIEAIFRGEAG